MNENLTLEQQLGDWVRSAFLAAFPDSGLEDIPLGVQSAAQESFGDYQCNAAMAVSKRVRRSPREVAQKVLDAAGKPEFLEKAEIAGPGFLNFTLKDDWIARQTEALASNERLGVPALGAGRTVILDYSSPNVAKPMHIGHIRSTVIGNALDRLYRCLGYRVVSDNHLGDWGTQFGLLLVGFRAFADPAAYEASPIEELERIYVKSYEQSKADPAWLDTARAELVKLQQGDPENRKLWESFVEHSMGEFEKIYGRLGVRFDLIRGESWYNDRLPGVVERLEKLGLARESRGALCVFSDGTLPPKEDPLVKSENGEWVPNPCIVRKSDGGFNYAATDLATALSRDEEFSPETIIYVTDERQQLHFRQVFQIASKLGIKARMAHVWFGLMRLPEGTFSTRQGNVIKLERMLDEAETRALAMVKETSPEMPEARQREVARCVGLGAIKYADLSQNPQSLVTFTWDKALALDGNSAPYLQYACARIAAVREKYAEQVPDGKPEAHPIRLGETVERRLALRLLRFPTAVLLAAEGFRPNVLADHLYDLAQTYSSFYQNVPFLKAEPGVRESRIRLCEATLRVLRKGLDLLGIETPERI
ncbi:MAG: arginine--tRNA ligase [Kiritimatiellia bacterium]|nr:arginine--tRNA ligase [Kiritimatiellia bacterium]